MIIAAFYLKIEIINDGSTEVVRDINAFNACPRLDWTLIEPWKMEISPLFFCRFHLDCTMKNPPEGGPHRTVTTPLRKGCARGPRLLASMDCLGHGAPWFLPRESITYTLQYNTNTNTIQYKYNTIQYIHRTYIYIYIVLYYNIMEFV